jgi:hypothetical protein
LSFIGPVPRAVKGKPGLQVKLLNRQRTSLKVWRRKESLSRLKRANLKNHWEGPIKINNYCPSTVIAGHKTVLEQ